jgi:hypothetical protein
MTDFYILDGHAPIPVDIHTWGPWFENMENRIVASHRWDYPFKIHVSTVFVGMDLDYGADSPMLYETMIFAPALPDTNEDQYWHADWDEAAAKHRAVVTELTCIYGPPQEGIER